MIEGAVAYYARTVFEVADDALGSLQLSYRRDDGIVVYLNGEEIHRCSNMPPGEITAETRTLGQAAEGQWQLVRLGRVGNLLRVGENLLAVEIHQVSENSSDIFLDLELTSETWPEELFDRLTEEEMTGALKALELLVPAHICESLDELLSFCLAPSLDSTSPIASSPAMVLSRIQIQFELNEAVAAQETWKSSRAQFEEWKPAMSRSWRDELLRRLRELE